MIVLALDTTTAAGSIAVCRGPQVLAEARGDASRPHGERLPSDLLSLLARAGCGLAEVDLFVVAAGPGAFTGLRIGIAAVQGLAFGSGRPAAGVSALEAHGRLLVETQAREPGSLVGVWMDAARGEVFAALYEVMSPGTELRPVVPDRVGAPGDILRSWGALRGGRQVRWTGEGAARYAALLVQADPGAQVIVEGLPPLARAVAELGRAAYRTGRAGLPHAIQPIYVRRPDAELARERRAAAPGGRARP